MLAAKALVLTVVTVVVAAVSIALAYVVTMPLPTDHDLVPALDEARTWQVFGGTVYCLVAAALFALGVGTLLRSSAAAITLPTADERRFYRYPMRHVVAVLDGDAGVQAAVQGLRESGVDPGSVTVLSGPDGARLLDRKGGGHGLAAAC